MGSVKGDCTESVTKETEALNLRKESSISIIQEHVNKLYDFRDHYFETNSIDKASQKNDEVKQKLLEVLQVFEEHKDACEKEDKAQFYMLKGKALNVLPNFDPQALEVLTRAVKLRPQYVDAWNELGECYWKKGDVPAAKNCFEGALKYSKNQVSLRNLSMVLRQLGASTPEERLQNLRESFEKAKDAVQLDVNDGTSWYILGNAYLSLFFATNQDPLILQRCKSCYSKAKNDKRSANNPDVHYNNAVALKYEEEYQDALEEFERAAALEPPWEVPKAKLQDIVSYLQNVQNMILKKGCLKPKRLQSMLASMKPRHLGPYSNLADGSLSSSSPTSHSLVPLKDLNPGKNANKVVWGKVVCNVQSGDPIPFTFCLVDSEQTCFSVTVYNQAEGKGPIIGDTVVIVDPLVKEIKVRFKEYELDFKSIRVDTPMQLIINGKKIGLDHQAPPQLNITVKSE